MDTFARNALRITLAGAGIAVLGASYVGQASAEEAPAGAADSPSPSTSEDAGSAAQSVPTPSGPQDLIAPDSLDTFVLPTVSDIAGL